MTRRFCSGYRELGFKVYIKCVPINQMEVKPAYSQEKLRRIREWATAKTLNRLELTHLYLEIVEGKPQYPHEINPDGKITHIPAFVYEYYFETITEEPSLQSIRRWS